MAKLKNVGDHAKQDTQIAAGLATAGLLSDQGLQAMTQVLQGAKDPVQALAHVIFMALSKVRQKLIQKGIKIDDKVWIAGGGVLDRVMFEVMTALVGILGYKQAGDATFVHNVKEAVLDLMNSEEEQSEQGSDNEEAEESPEEEASESPEEEQQEQQQGTEQQPKGIAAPPMGAS